MKIKKRYKLFLIIIILVIIIGIFYYYNKPKEVYNFKNDKIYYSQERGKLDFERKLNYINESYVVYNISYKSRNFLNYETKIYGYLYLPKTTEKVPGLVYLPGGGMTKDGAGYISKKIVSLGYAVLTIDQRGVGQTGGVYLNIEQDYEIFSKGKEPIQHLVIYDALRSFDLLRELPEVDQDNIAIGGESMGGRYAIIAASQDKRFKGLIVIASGGFNYKPKGNIYDKYLLSIDPDYYIQDISNKQVIMIHGTNDSVVKIENAKLTFNKAKKPKKFFSTKDCGHGYCDKMHEYLRLGLKQIFS